MAENLFHVQIIHVSKTYDKAVKDLLAILNDDEQTLELKKKCFVKFYQKFTTPHEFWNSWVTMEETIQRQNGNGEVDELYLINFYRKALEHFPSTIYLENDIMREKGLRPQINNYKIKMEALIDTAFYYETSMEENFDNFWDGIDFRTIFLNPLWHKVNRTKFTPHEENNKVEETLKIYSELIELHANDNIPKLINTLKKTENTEYIIKNIEEKLSFYYSKKSLWELYFYYSEKYDLKKLLDVYRRYCRLFVDDLPMRKKYRETIEKAEKLFNASKWILDSIKLEADFTSEKAANKMIKKVIKQKFNNTINLTSSKNFEENFKLLTEKFAKTQDCEKNISLKMLKFEETSLIRLKQNYFYPKPLINYIHESANYEITRKLQRSSKESFILTNKSLCFKLSITNVNQTQIHDEALFISATTPNITIIKKIIVKNTLFVCYPKADTLSNFIPKISKCDLRYLIVSSQILTLCEYKFLLKPGKIERISLDETIIKIDDKKIASLEEVMENLSQAEALKFIPSPSISIKTFGKINQMKRKVKISCLYISPIIDIFDPIDFCTFLSRHASKNSIFSLKHLEENGIDSIEPLLIQLLEKWNPTNDKPTVKLTYAL